MFGVRIADGRPPCPANAAFPFSDKSKWMAMISVYLDETGESTDARQHVVGMGGLIGMDKHWEDVERNWKKALKDAEVPLFKNAREPYFHMREYVKSVDTFKGWDGKKAEGEKLFDELLTIIETGMVCPFGATMPLSIWRNLTPQQQYRLLDPYYFSAQFCIWNILSLTADRPPEEKVTPVFSEKKKVQRRIRELFDLFRERDKNTRGKINDPTFREMRESPALQAADVVVHTLNSEQRRQIFNPTEPQSDMYVRLCEAQRKLVDSQDGLFYFIPEARVMADIKEFEADIARRQVNTSA